MKLHPLPVLFLLAAHFSQPAQANTNLLLSTCAQTIGGGLDDNFHHNGATQSDQFGYTLGGGGDVNSDGIPDYIIASPYIQQGGVVTGGANVYSGADNSLIYSFFGPPDSSFGWSAAFGGDIDGDGVDDILVGAPTHAENNMTIGMLVIYSGADGSEFGAIKHFQDVNFGVSVCGAGDVDQDGYGDILMAEGTGGIHYQGQVLLWSQSQGTIATATGDTFFAGFGHSIADVGDVNGDGFKDFAVGSPRSENLFLSEAGAVELLSGTDLSVIWKKSNTAAWEHFGTSVAAFPDLNHDGIGEVVVGIPDYNWSAGAVEILSGADGTLLLRVEGQNQGSNFGHSVANAGDVNGDLIADLLIGAPNESPGGLNGSGGVHIYSGADGSYLDTVDEPLAGKQSGWAVANIQGGATLSPNMLMYSSPNDSTHATDSGSVTGFGFNPYLTASTGELSQSAGGSISYEINFPDDAAGDTYQLLASGLGSGPTLLPNGIEVPLSLDSMLVQTYLGIMPPIIQNGVGTLDGEGKASVQLNAPAGVIPASLIGVEYTLAAACRYGLDLWRYSSVAIGLTITP